MGFGSTLHADSSPQSVGESVAVTLLVCILLGWSIAWCIGRRPRWSASGEPDFWEAVAQALVVTLALQTTLLAPCLVLALVQNLVG